MDYGEWGFMGMHLFWWIFWLVIGSGVVASMFAAIERPRSETEPSLVRLQRRFVDGEITRQEYEERKAILNGEAHP